MEVMAKPISMKLSFFINRNWTNPNRNWNHQLQEIEAILTKFRKQWSRFERRAIIEELLKQLPHTMDTYSSRLDKMNFEQIVSDLLGELRSIQSEST